jgi:hypothetical protein
MRARPAGVLGPVDLPPWKRQRALPGSALTWQRPQTRVLAPQRCRPLRRIGDGRSDANTIFRFSQGLLAMMPGSLFPSSRNCLKKSGSLVRSTEQKSVTSSGPAIPIPSKVKVSSPHRTNADFLSELREDPLLFSFSGNAASYFPRPRLRSQTRMSMTAPTMGSAHHRAVRGECPGCPREGGFSVNRCRCANSCLAPRPASMKRKRISSVRSRLRVNNKYQEDIRTRTHPP